MNFLWQVTVPGLARTCPRSISVLWIPRRSAPMLSPAWAWSRSFLNISIPVTTVFLTSSWIPKISTSELITNVPLSTRPVATVPRPVIVNTSSIGIRNGLSTSLSGFGMYESTASISSMILSAHAPLGSLSAWRAEPWITGMSSPGNSYSERSSLISISTSSKSSASSTISHLFINTTI